ncbi:phosphate signaling complex protein PhoU [Ostreibacterium oceani]|uniref:Phosphate-specific transport system accessory protein PhoU n=1 Tax=Ostreibacterium oceani TaxID=2654998 RepID=A0A6N7ESC6_9GAMM|nr:phosphate signaling complex protein PhoU [Ostreibacterium oceani]MPV85402.1 phosphate signaling complex protein PhoU [Ostreibacterium oceani]
MNIEQQPFGQHISKKYDGDLQQLRDEVIIMGSMVEQQLKDGLECLMNADLELAKAVVKNDKKINQQDLKIDEQCVQLLALRQPTASDLRLITSILKSITDLERMGDLAQHLGKVNKLLIKDGVSAQQYVELRHLGELVQAMLKNALDAFTRLDIEGALQTIAQDKQVNREYEALSRQLITYMMEDPRTIKQTLRIFNAARALERFGDHCKNLCEYVIYLVRGEDIRYQDIDDVREALLEEGSQET